MVSNWDEEYEPRLGASYVDISIPPIPESVVAVQLRVDAFRDHICLVDTEPLSAHVPVRR